MAKGWSVSCGTCFSASTDAASRGTSAEQVGGAHCHREAEDREQSHPIRHLGALLLHLYDGQKYTKHENSKGTNEAQVCMCVCAGGRDNTK